MKKTKDTGKRVPEEDVRDKIRWIHIESLKGKQSASSLEMGTKRGRKGSD